MIFGHYKVVSYRDEEPFAMLPKADSIDYYILNAYTLNDAHIFELSYNIRIG